MRDRLRILLAVWLVALMTGLLPAGVKESRAQSSVSEGSDVGLYVPGRVLVGFREGVKAGRAGAAITALGSRDRGRISRTRVHTVDVPTSMSEAACVDYFRSLPDVEFAELDRLLPAADMSPNDPWYPNEWHMPKIACPTAWSTTTGSNNVTIAICDTGVDSNHSDLAGKLVAGWNFWDNNADTSDVYGHGTKVAGTAAAKSNNSTGVPSIAWGCKIMPLRVSDANGYASYSTIAAAITYAADHGARVANASYACTNSLAVQSAAQHMQSLGGVVTVAAGNGGLFDSTADNPYVLTVSASDGSDNLYSWSNRGNNVDLAAPGFVYTTVRGGGYGSSSGTSISAPIVAGVAALMISANPSLSGSEIQDMLKQSADDRGAAGWDTSFGWGRVNAATAVALSGGGSQPPPDTTPPTVSITSPAEGSSVSGSVTIQVSASDDTAVSSVSLTVDGVLLGQDATAPYTFSWDTTSASNGAHTLTATADDAAGNTSNDSSSVSVNNQSDTTAPVVTITSPAQGARVSGNVQVGVTASDNNRVVKVELYVDGALKTSSTAAPFTNNWNSRKASSGAHLLQCKAYDAAGNTAFSQVVTVYR